MEMENESKERNGVEERKNGEEGRTPPYNGPICTWSVFMETKLPSFICYQAGLYGIAHTYLVWAVSEIWHSLCVTHPSPKPIILSRINFP